MSKRKSQLIKTSDAITRAVQKLMTKDAFTNSMARLGFGQPTVSEGARYPLTRLTMNYNLMTVIIP